MCAQRLTLIVRNALKFTKQQAVRQVHVMFGASRQRPTEAQLQVQFATSNETAVATNGTSHSDEELYLWFIVKDTGEHCESETPFCSYLPGKHCGLTLCV